MKSNIAKSLEKDAALAVKEIKKQLDTVNDIQCIILFASHSYDANALATTMNEEFPNIEWFGTTSYNEVVENMIVSNSLVAFAITSDLVEDFRIEMVENLKTNTDVEYVIKNFEEHFNTPLGDLQIDKYFGFALMDFQSKAEEKLFDKLGDYTNVAFLGGTASDNWKFVNTGIYAKGKYHNDAAVIGLFKSKVKFGFEKIETVVKVAEPLTVTKSDIRNKKLYEIDGRPAAEVYCEINGLDYEKTSKLSPPQRIWSNHPLGISIDGEIFLRDVYYIDTTDKSLVMVCNIPEGLPVHFYKVANITESTRTQLENIRKKYNNIGYMITLVCANVYEDVMQGTNVEEYASLYAGISCVGFCTFGEYYTVPVNHTTTLLILEQP